MRLITFFIAFSLVVLCSALSFIPDTIFSSSDKTAYKNLYIKTIGNAKDLSQYVYPIIALEDIGFENDIPKITCQRLLDLEKNELNAQELYFISMLIDKVPGCKLIIPADSEDVLKNKVTEQKSIMKLYQIYKTMIEYGHFVISDKFYNQMLEILTNDPSINNIAFFLKFVLLNPKHRDSKVIEAQIKNVMLQAEEIDNKFLQFNGGVAITGLLMDTIYKLSKQMPIENQLNEERVLKSVNYLLDKKNQTDSKNAYYIYQALKSISNHKMHSPVVISFHVPASTITNKHPNLIISISDIFGHTISKDKELSITATLTNQLEPQNKDMIKTITNFKSFSKTTPQDDKNKNVWYQANIKDIKLPIGASYEILLDIQQPASTNVEVKDPVKTKTYFGLKGATTVINLAREIALNDVVLQITDKEHGTNTQKISLPTATLQKHADLLKLFPHNKMSLTFSIKDDNDENVFVQQVFVRFTSRASHKKEVIFVAEPKANTKIYEFDLILDNKRAKEFDHLSGEYEVELFVGDRFISNPIKWTFTDCQLNFPSVTGDVSPTEAKVKEAESRFAEKAEIKHVFKVPEKRPPMVVSLMFCALVIMPALYMIIMWLKIGFNFERFTFSIWAIIFHLSLAAVFGLYVMFWLKLNMFQTLKYMTLLGPILFFSGNRLLRSLATQRKKGM
ncbi:dolichyl-diphosphooligosaccharide--protein glycosyltransferase subunit 2-like isoform X2 [Gordionus sp. m RMFG-2023]|uniref:dolichyl-diphosphooligosaccharide--protein glycosyltransferase subunit 2-like isoform X2 n=1 Tax=Gordionus sp. m RMFG-2023 TaxID=3053472 RepID=UPI0031FBA786